MPIITNFHTPRILAFSFKYRQKILQFEGGHDVYDLYQPLVDKVIYIDDQPIDIHFENKWKHATQFCLSIKFSRVYNQYVKNRVQRCQHAHKRDLSFRLKLS